MADWLQLFQRYLPDFLKGAAVTIELTVVGLALGFRSWLIVTMVSAVRW